MFPQLHYPLSKTKPRLKLITVYWLPFLPRSHTKRVILFWRSNLHMSRGGKEVERAGKGRRLSGPKLVCISLANCRLKKQPQQREKLRVKKKKIAAGKTSTWVCESVWVYCKLIPSQFPLAGSPFSWGFLFFSVCVPRPTRDQLFLGTLRAFVIRAFCISGLEIRRRALSPPSLLPCLALAFCSLYKFVQGLSCARLYI